MADKELLTAIKEMMEQQLSSIKDDISGIKIEVSDIKTDVSGIKIMLDNEIRKNINLLAEGHFTLLDKANKIEELQETVEDIQTNVDVIYAVTQKNTRDIIKLHKVQ